MKPTSPEQLARLLDQMSGSYPHGIPISAIQAAREPELECETPATTALYDIFIVGEEGSASPAAQELLVGITSKGLKVSEGDYTVTYVTSEEFTARSSDSVALHVVVFGADREPGWGARVDGRRTLFTHSLEKLVHDVALKKDLWRHLQEIVG